MHDIFISYSHKDKQWVSKFAHVLEERGYKVWWDKDLLISQDYAAVIEEVLNSTKCVITIWSPNSVKSKWVRAESSRGFNENKMVPVLIEEASIPIPFDSVHTADMRSWKGREKDQSFIDLINSLEWILNRDDAAILPQAFATIPETSKAQSKSGSGVRNVLFAIGAIVAMGAGYFALNQSEKPRNENTVIPSQTTAKDKFDVEQCQDTSTGQVLSIIQASGRHETGCVLEYIAHDVDINKTDDNGWTALHAAAANGHEDIARKIIATGEAQINLKNNLGMTPIYLAVLELGKKDLPFEKADKLRRLVIYLKDNGASTTVVDGDGNTLLSRAKGNPELLKILGN